MLLDQKKTKRMVRIFAVIASIGFVGALIPILVIVIVQGGGDTPEQVRQNQIEDARQATVDRPRDPDAWDELAQLLIQDGDAKGAVAPARQAVRLDPKTYDRVEILAIALDSDNQTAAAITAVQRYTRANPRNAEGFFLLGQLAEKAVRTPLARLAYARVLALDDTDSITAQEAQARLDQLNGTTTTTTPTSPSTTATTRTTRTVVTP